MPINYRRMNREELLALCQERGIAVAPEASCQDMFLLLHTSDAELERHLWRRMADSSPRHANSGFDTAEGRRLRIAPSIIGPNASRAELLHCYLKLSQADDMQTRGSSPSNSIVTVPAPLRVPADFFPKMPETSDDIITFFESFDRACVVNGVSRSDWASYLAVRLTGKALEAYSEVPIEDLRDYDRIKDALLRRYAVTPDTYRVNFRSIHRKPEETIAGLYHRLGFSLSLQCKEYRALGV
ncbi:hypothetical protein XELAEV_18043668mg [Xenopus laevis]|uniref:Uncharacterized protein n=1 Tax=Xenopus laevis TaxID=8355 RepID=A0A974BXL8_XENLA|nr:hypothetical protein XELAEV_18043668mg [Xenopus laevis]